MQALRRLVLKATLASLSVLSAAFVQAEDFPVKPIKMVVGFSAGGSIDAVARAVAEAIRPGLGQPVIVENKPGAAGRIGNESVVRSPADGYTMVMTGTSIGVEPLLYKKMSYDINQLVPVGTVARSPLLVVVVAASPYKTLPELIAASKVAGANITYASPGIGTPNHLAPAALAARTGAKLTHIPYKGNQQAVSDLLGGQVHMMFTTIPAVLPHVQSGKLRALAVSNAKRVPSLPDVATVTELGIGMPDLSLSYGLMLRAETPPVVVARLRKELQAALRTPAFLEQLGKLGLEPMTGTAEEFTTILKREQGVYGEVIRLENIQLE